jgi:hypothetical protein
MGKAEAVELFEVLRRLATPIVPIWELFPAPARWYGFLLTLGGVMT